VGVSCKSRSGLSVNGRCSLEVKLLAVVVDICRVFLFLYLLPRIIIFLVLPWEILSSEFCLPLNQQEAQRL
jgi:hypothetical protein